MFLSDLDKGVRYLMAGLDAKGKQKKALLSLAGRHFAKSDRGDRKISYSGSFHQKMRKKAAKRRLTARQKAKMGIQGSQRTTQDNLWTAKAPKAGTWTVPKKRHDKRDRKGRFCR